MKKNNAVTAEPDWAGSPDAGQAQAAGQPELTLLGEGESAPSPIVPSPEILNDAEAEEYLVRLAGFDAQRLSIEEQMAAAMRPFEEQLGLVARRRAELVKAEGSFLAWASARLDIQNQGLARPSKTLKMANGSVSWKTVPGGLTMVDAKAAFVHAKEQGWAGVIRTKEELDPTAYRELAQMEMETTGEMIPGIEMRPDRETHEIKLTPQKAN
jgi:phage host-nuclease inhibitor protein Gam